MESVKDFMIWREWRFAITLNFIVITINFKRILSEIIKPNSLNIWG